MKHINKQIKISFTNDMISNDKLSIESLFNALKLLPKDTLLLGVSKNWGNEMINLDFYNDVFPETYPGMGEWEVKAELKDEALHIEWPEAFKTLFKANPVDEAIDLWSYESPAVEVVKTVKCEHVWQATRFGAFKYCKLCNALGENEYAQH